MLSKFLPLGALALMLSAFAAPASAAPVSSLDGVKGGSPSATEQVAYRRCWWEHGRRHCRRTVTRYYYDDGYYGYGPGYYGPGIGLYFGGGGHHRHHGGHHHH